MKRNGFSLIEALIVVAIAGIVAGMALKLYPMMTLYFLQGQARQRANFEARACLDAIGVATRQGLAGSIQPLLTAPTSWIGFNAASPLPTGTKTYRFSLLADGTVEEQDITTTSVVRKRTLASNVSTFLFSGNPQDPSVIYVTLQIDVPIGGFTDASGHPRVATVRVDTEEFHLAVNPG